MSMGAGGDKNVMNEINVTPMVDVMLVLLIIFMVVTPTLLAGFQLTLPVGSNLKERPEEEGRVTMGIDVNGGYYMNGKPMRREDAIALLTAAFAAKAEDKVLFLKADVNLPYSEVERVFEIARSSGARVVAAVSDLPPAPLVR